MAAPPKTTALPFAAEIGRPEDVTWSVLEVAIDWVERHCVIPDRFEAGKPYKLAGYQLWFYANHYRLKEDAHLTVLPDGEEVPSGASAFYYRRSQIIMSQKAGKGPYAAAVISNEAAGPALFAGWAVSGDAYDCADHGCPCGWGWEYEAGEPKGMPWPTPLIQLTAFSDDQTENTYGPLQSMIRNGPLGELLMSQRRWGTTRCRKFLGRHDLLETKPIGSLTMRQRHLLASGLGVSSSRARELELAAA